jgi:hypothetical protein
MSDIDQVALWFLFHTLHDFAAGVFHVRLAAGTSAARAGAAS